MTNIGIQRIAVFPVDDTGRQQIAHFQANNRIISIHPGEMVLQEKKVPAIWIVFIEGLDPYLEQGQKNGESKPSAKKRTKA